MTEPKPTYNTDPIVQDPQTIARLYLMMKEFHEMGLNIQRQLEAIDALPKERKLFLTKNERYPRDA
jgi:hypothetical protein